MQISGNKQHNAYEILLNGLDLYLNMYEKGLKKQANKYISSFIDEFEHSTPKEDLEKFLCRFCQEICDEDKHSQLLSRGNGSLPYDLGKIVWNYLKNQCEAGTMPHMRWAFQLFGKSYNPFDPQLKLDMFKVLKKHMNTKTAIKKQLTSILMRFWNSYIGERIISQMNVSLQERLMKRQLKLQK